MISSRFNKFVWKNGNVAICRCPICGDSTKNKTKRRFYFYENRGMFFVKCHNCSYSSSFSKFLKTTDNSLYRNYILELYKEGILKNGEEQNKIQEIVPCPVLPTSSVAQNNIQKALKSLISVDKLPDSNEARTYVVSRRIPPKFYSRLFFCEDFGAFSAQIDPCSKNSYKEPRLIIPFYDESGVPFMCQGRSLPSSDSSIRYMTIKEPGTTKSKIYGLDRFDPKKPFYVVEGPFDSMFLENCIAVAGSDFGLISGNCTVVLDNETRNAEISNQYRSCIKRGLKVCIWPKEIVEKDINEMVLSGKTNIQEIIDNNTYCGLAATLAFNNWSKR